MRYSRLHGCLPGAIAIAKCPLAEIPTLEVIAEEGRRGDAAASERDGLRTVGRVAGDRHVRATTAGSGGREGDVDCARSSHSDRAAAVVGLGKVPGVAAAERDAVD